MTRVADLVLAVAELRSLLDDVREAVRSSGEIPKQAPSRRAAVLSHLPRARVGIVI
jgi:hypothetical protein